MQNWRPHPAAEMFPMLEGIELQDLMVDIAENGLREPVWLYRDNGETLLLDGRNRVRACSLAGVPVETRLYEGPDPIAFAVSLNVRRRHLTEGQKAMIGLAVLPLYEAEAAKRMLAGVADPGAPVPQGRAPRSRDHAAKVVGTSGRAVAQAKRVTEQAPDLAEQVKAGTLPLKRAERIVRDREAEGRRIQEAQAQAAAQPIELRVDLRHGDFREVLADLTDVDAIITDPPYPAEFLPLLYDLGQWADTVLAPDGVLVVLVGEMYLPQVFRLLEGGRPYRWTAAYLTPGPGSVVHARRVQSNWKPLLIYGGGPRFADVFASTGRDANAKELHHWGQDYGAFHEIVERLTRPGQTVCDPFMGSGTTLLAAHALGRHAIGCDVDEAAVATARERLGG